MTAYLNYFYDSFKQAQALKMNNSFSGGFNTLEKLDIKYCSNIKGTR